MLQLRFINLVFVEQIYLRGDMEVEGKCSEVEAVFLPLLLFELADVGFSELVLAEVPVLGAQISRMMKDREQGIHLAGSNHGGVSSYGKFPDSPTA